LLLYIIKNTLSLENFQDSIKNILTEGFQPWDTRPESMERILFITGIITFPLFLLISHLLLKKYCKFIYLKKIQTLIIYISIIIIIIFCWWVIKTTEYTYVKHNLFYNYPIKTLLLFLIIIILTWFTNKKKIYPKTNKIINFIASICTIFILTFITVFHLIRVDTIIEAVHFNAVFHSVAQVINGKAILIDFVHQYGLYPHFIEPILRILGTSVFNFSLLMGLLTSLSFLFIYIILRNTVKNRIIVLLGFSSIIFHNFLLAIINYPYPYFQYHPIRIVFPTLIILIACIYFRKQNKNIYYLGYFISTLSILWNIDTGIIVFLSWILTLIFNELLKNNICKYKRIVLSSLKHIFNGIVFLLFTFTFFNLYFFIRYSAFPDFNQFFEYQKLFYIYGITMRLMTLWHPWNIILFIYAIGLIISIRSILYRINILKNKIIFITSILGVGIFSYYQGRSLNAVLPAVWYPANILIIIYADICLNKYFKFKQKYWILISLMLIYILSSSFFSLISNYQIIVKPEKIKQNFLSKKVETPLISNALFIKKNTSPKEEIFIISPNYSGILHLISKTTNAVNNPSLTETVLRKDYEKIYKKLENGTKIFLENDQINNYSKIKKIISEKYKVVKENPSGNIILLIKKNKNELLFKNTFILNDNKNQLKTILHYTLDPFLRGYFNKEEKFINFTSSSQMEKIIISKEFSVELIIKPNNQQVQYACIIGNHPGINGEPPSGFVIQQNGNITNQYGFSYGTGTTWTDNLIFNLDHNIWQYITITISNEETKIYINGIFINSVPTIAPIRNTTLPLFINNWMNKDRPFNGIIQEVKISQAPMSEEIIKNNWETIKKINFNLINY